MSFDLERPVQYLISPGDAAPESFLIFKEQFLRTIQLAVEAGISLVQIRENLISTKQLFELTTAAVEITQNSKTKLLVNGRADVALSGGADGVHLPESGVPVAAIRNAFPLPFMIGCSVHSVERAVAAKDDGADFLLFGPVFDSRDKKGIGLAELTTVCEAVPNTPVIAVGGIDASNHESVIGAGAAGYAAIRYLNDRAFLKKLI